MTTQPPLDLSKIWSYSKLPDLYMSVQDPSTPAPASVDPPAAPAKVEDAGKKETNSAKLTEEQMESDGDWISNLQADDNQKKFLKRVITQNKNRKTELDEAKAKLAEREAKDAEEQRKRDVEQGNWKKIAEENEAKLKAKDERLLRAEVKALAIKEGWIDPSLIDLLPLEGVGLADDGSITGVDKFIAKYKKEKSYLFGEGKRKEPEGTTSGKTTPTPNTQAVAKDAMDMTDAEFKEFLKNRKK